MLWRYRQAVSSAGDNRLGLLTALVGIGYFFMWTVFGMAAFPLSVALAANEAVRRMNFGWLTLDAEGRNLDADAHGENMLAESKVLIRGRGAKLAARNAAVGRDDQWSSADRCEQLGQLFDLTPRQAGLALALSRGMTIAEAARELGLSVESARTYSKRIYLKTGARGQADLVRFIHRSVLTIA